MSWTEEAAELFGIGISSSRDTSEFVRADAIDMQTAMLAGSGDSPDSSRLRTGVNIGGSNRRGLCVLSSSYALCRRCQFWKCPTVLTVLRPRVCTMLRRVYFGGLFLHALFLNMCASARVASEKDGAFVFSISTTCRCFAVNH